MNRMRGSRLPLALVAGAAAPGVLLGHWVAYAIVVPGAALRRSFLEATGHGYWSTALALALVAGAIAIAGVAGQSFRRGMRREEPADWPAHYAATALRLIALQCAVFVVQEMLERALVGAPLGAVLHDSLLPIGLAMQVLVGALVALVLALIGLSAEAVGRARGDGRVPLPAHGLLSWPETNELGAGPPRRVRSIRAPPTLLPA